MKLKFFHTANLLLLCTPHNHFTRSLLKWKRSMKNLSILIFLFSLARCYLFLNIYRKARCDMRSPLTTAFFFFALFLLSLSSLSVMCKEHSSKKKRGWKSEACFRIFFQFEWLTSRATLTKVNEDWIIFINLEILLPLTCHRCWFWKKLLDDSAFLERLKLRIS